MPKKIVAGTSFRQFQSFSAVIQKASGPDLSRTIDYLLRQDSRKFYGFLGGCFDSGDPCIHTVLDVFVCRFCALKEANRSADCGFLVQLLQSLPKIVIADLFENRLTSSHWRDLFRFWDPTLATLICEALSPVFLNSLFFSDFFRRHFFDSSDAVKRLNRDLVARYVSRDTLFQQLSAPFQPPYNLFEYAVSQGSYGALISWFQPLSRSQQQALIGSTRFDLNDYLKVFECLVRQGEASDQPDQKLFDAIGQFLSVTTADFTKSHPGTLGVVWGICELLFDPTMIEATFKKGCFLCSDPYLLSEFMSFVGDVFESHSLDAYELVLDAISDYTHYVVSHKFGTWQEVQKCNLIVMLLMEHLKPDLDWVVAHLPYENSQKMLAFFDEFYGVCVLINRDSYPDSQFGENLPPDIRHTLLFRKTVIDELTYDLPPKSRSNAVALWFAFRSNLQKCKGFHDLLSLDVYQSEDKLWEPLTEIGDSLWVRIASISFDALTQVEMARIYLLLRDLGSLRPQLRDYLSHGDRSGRSRKRLDTAPPVVPDSSECVAARAAERAAREAAQRAEAEASRLARQAAEQEAAALAALKEKERRAAAEVEKVAKVLEALQPFSRAFGSLRLLKNELRSLNSSHPLLANLEKQVAEIWESMDIRQIGVLTQKFIKTDWRQCLSKAIQELEKKPRVARSKPFHTHVSGGDSEGTLAREESPVFAGAGAAVAVGKEADSGALQPLTLEEYQAQLSLSAVLREKQDHFVYKPDWLTPACSESEFLEFMFSTAYRMIEFLNVLEKLLDISDPHSVRPSVSHFRGRLVHDLYYLVEMPDILQSRAVSHQLYAAAIKLFHMDAALVDLGHDFTHSDISGVLDIGSAMFDRPLALRDSSLMVAQEMFLGRLYRFISGVEISESGVPSPSLVFAVGAFIELSRTFDLHGLESGPLRDAIQKLQSRGYAHFDRNDIFHLEHLDPKMIWAYVSVIQDCKR